MSHSNRYAEAEDGTDNDSKPDRQDRVRAFDVRLPPAMIARIPSASLCAAARARFRLSVGAGEGNRTLDIQLGKLSFYL